MSDYRENHSTQQPLQPEEQGGVAIQDEAVQWQEVAGKTASQEETETIPEGDGPMVGTASSEGTENAPASMPEAEAFGEGDGPPLVGDSQLESGKVSSPPKKEKVKRVKHPSAPARSASPVAPVQGQSTGETTKPAAMKGFVVVIACIALLLVAVVASTISAVKEGAAPIPLDIKIVELPDFIETGIFGLTGFGRMKPSEIEAALTLEPDIPFSVAIDPNDPSVALVSLQEHRGIAYKGVFQVGERSDPDFYRKTFTVNGPPLTVRLSKTTFNPDNNVTLHFSEPVDIDSLYDYLLVEPQTAYSLSYSGSSVTLSPDRGWNRSANYQIRINARYESLNGKQFAEHQVLSFKVQEPVATPKKPSVEFISDENYVLNEYRDMTLVFQAKNLAKPVPVVVETYRMDSIEKYRDQGGIYLDYDLSLSYLEKVDTNAFLIENGENRMVIPHQGEGGYIISAKYINPHTEKEVEVRSSYLISSLSVYLQSSNRETIVWLNSSRDGVPLEGYEISFAGNPPSGVTGEDGVLVVPHELAEGSQEVYRSRESFSIRDPEGALIYYDDSGMLRGRIEHSERYYSYLFLDRTLYQPRDTVCFWGFVAPFRYNELEMPEQVAVRFDPGGLDIEIICDINERGVYSGEIPLEQIRSSQYVIVAEFRFPSEEEDGIGIVHQLDTEYISVKEYEKPSYVLSSGVERTYYGPYDTVTATASASFYDGTPLPYFPLEAFYYDNARYEWVQLPDVLTDDRGNATFSFPANSSGENLYSKGLMEGSFRVRIASDGEQINHVGRYSYFPSDVLVDSKLQKQAGGENLELVIQAYELDMESPRLKAELEARDSGYYYLSEERLLEIARGKPVDVTVDVSLRWDYFDLRNIRHRQNYEYYYYWGYMDEMKFTDSYSLNHVLRNNPDVLIIPNGYTDEKLVRVSTQNGKATVTDLVYLGEGGGINFERSMYCHASFSYKDGVGHTYQSSAYYPSWDGYRESWDDPVEPKPAPGYSFAVTNLDTGKDITPENSYYRSLTAGAGQRLRFDLLLNGEPVEADGKILYSIIQDGLYEHHVVNGSAIELNYRLDWAREVKLVAVYFDGQGTREVKQIDLYCDSTSLSLKLDITPDREAYRPGDTVRLQVKATDYQGRGVAGNLCVAVVDESLFALSEQYISVLYDLYRNSYQNRNSVSQYFTTYRDEPEELYPGADGGKGSGGGIDFYDSYRSNFKDTALFLPAVTDAAGNATITFTLPDNTTSWRITAVEISDQLLAGQAKDNIISTLPFFVKPVITSRYIDGDDFAMLVQGHGTLLKADDDIHYTVTITGDGVNRTQTLSGKAFQPMEVNFGKLPIGEYTVVSKAQYSGYSDTVELPVSIIKSNLELVIHRAVDIDKLAEIEAVRYPVSITFYDRENEAFMASVNSMFGHYCMQTSQRLSRFVAKRVIRQSMPEREVPTYIADTKENIADMQNLDGGIGHSRNGESDPLLTSYVLLIAKDQFHLPSMARYFRDELTYQKDEKIIAACYLGLAAIGDITADEILELLEQAERVDIQAYYIAALAYLYEEEAALELYQERLAPIIADINKTARKELEWERDAAAIWIAASRLHHPDADTLSLHFGKNVWRIRTLYEAMIYVSNYQGVVRPTSFSYTLKGQAFTENLGYGGMKTLRLSKSDLESLRLTSYPEHLKAVAYYVGEPSELGMEQSSLMSIEKKIVPLENATYEVTLDIYLMPDAPLGQYDINDWVPSNARLYSYDKNWDVTDKNIVYFRTTTEGQKLYISFDNRVEQYQHIRYRYQIRQTFSSEAALDTVYMIHGDSGENCQSEKGFFTPNQKS